LSYPLLLAPLKIDDSNEEIIKKLNLVASYIESFVVRRGLNFRKFASSSIRYTMYSLVKEIRKTSIDNLKHILQAKLDEMPEKLEGIEHFRLHGQNKFFVKFLLSRISAFVETETGLNSDFVKFFENPKGKPFEVEHIWADKFEEHRDEFEQENEFHAYRNRLGDLVLLPRGTNQSFGAKPYSQKVEHYLKENLLIQTLNPKTYENNPNFLNMAKNLNLPFKPHQTFKKQDIEDRQKLYFKISKHIWKLSL